ncbi:Clp protease ClpP [Flavobacterium sp. Sd200]|uniref:head maturation protease, ClpP-related n=1 Tax=Flavobacterium sp. Sd200 TaxID=2692211 RepID=UPI00136B8BFD|nr:head maturation protease, ClpP-related [Flavobacterium sp. Sd200]MXN91299.1 Clp protease ClpP [Flavobacterium sp. Sd200]
MTGNIYISGQIGTFDGTAGIELIDVVSQVKKQPKATAFNVHINSEGGLVDVGFDIYQYLKSLKKPLTTIGSGIVASIATVIFMAGDKRQVRENTPFMIHLPWGGSMGTADELEQFAEQLRSIEKKMVAFYKKTLNVQEQAIMPLLKNETWLTGRQLASLGFTTSRQVKAAAKAFINTNSMRGTFTEKDRHWMEGLFTKVLGKFKNTHIFNKVVQDATGAEIDFTELGDDDLIEVGATATLDGAPAEGEYLMPDGYTYVFEAGELTEIIEPEEEEAETTALRAENKALKRQLNTIKSEVLALKKQVGSRFNVDGKKVAQRRGSEADKLAGMKEYLKNNRRK